MQIYFALSLLYFVGLSCGQPNITMLFTRLSSTDTITCALDMSETATIELADGSCVADFAALTGSQRTMCDSNGASIIRYSDSFCTNMQSIQNFTVGQCEFDANLNMGVTGFCGAFPSNVPNGAFTNVYVNGCFLTGRFVYGTYNRGGCNAQFCFPSFETQVTISCGSSPNGDPNSAAYLNFSAALLILFSAIFIF